MINRCHKCDEILQAGDLILVMVKSEYLPLKSKITFAISRNILDAYASSLAHAKCIEEQ